MVKFRDLNVAPLTMAKGPSSKGADDPEAGRRDAMLFTSSLPPPSGGEPTPKAISEESKLALYENATLFLAEVFSTARKGETLDLSAGFAIMREIVDSQTPQDALFIKSIHSDESYRFVLHHSVNVAIYAVKLADSLGYNRDRQIEVGMAGLLHEVGMALIPEELIFKSDLNERDFHVFRERPINGYNILKTVNEPYGYLAECALQVYERIDGSGYPKGLKGDEIHEYAQLIGLVDMYEALVHTRPQREKFLHYNAVKEIINTGKKCFQQRHIKALLKLFSVFPLLSYVKLNSKAIGKVIGTYPDQPMRPMLRMVMDSQRNMILSERLINLPDNPLLYITDALSEEDLVAYAESSYFRERSSARPHSDDNDNGDNNDPSSDRDASSTPLPTPRSGLWRRLSSRALTTGAAAAAVVVMAGVWLTGQRVDSSQSQTITARAAPSSPPASEVLLTVLPPMSPAFDPQDAPLLNSPAVAAQTQAVAAVDDGPPAGSGDGSVQFLLAGHNPAQPDDAQGFGTPSPEGDGLADKDLAPRRAYPFSLLLGSYGDVEQARQAVLINEKSELDSFWVKVDLGADGVRYRVFGGYFATPEDAKAAAVAHRLSPSAVKATRWAVQVGPSTSATDDNAANDYDTLRRHGFSPYRIAVNANALATYLGAFYTEKGAHDLLAELRALPLQGRVVQR